MTDKTIQDEIMNSSFKEINKAYERKLSLLQELLDCLKRERENLIELNLEAIWALMEEKQGVLEAIEETGKEIERIRENTPPETTESGKVQSMLVSFSAKINKLKEEIRVRVKENVEFIQDTLGFFDELISIFISGARPEPAYNPIRRSKHESPSLIYHREV